MFLKEEAEAVGVFLCRPPLPVHRVGVDGMSAVCSIELDNCGSFTSRAVCILAAILFAEVNFEWTPCWRIQVKVGWFLPFRRLMKIPTQVSTTFSLAR